MSNTVRLASFCRLCLSKTSNKVPIYGNGVSLENLLQLIEIKIDPDDEPDAVVCFDCMVTLEGFYQFKEQCHVNDEFVRNIPKNVDSNNTAEEEDDELSCDYLDEVENESNKDYADNYQEVEEENETVKYEIMQIEEPEEPKVQLKRKAISPNSDKLVTKPPNANSKIQSPETLDAEVIEQKCAKLLVPTRPSKGPTIDDLQVLADSYPDYFYFEKGPRSVYFTLVFYGERYHSALFTERFTYWQCIHRRKYQCPAQVCVTNNYQKFERRYEHTHGELPEKEGKIFTPLQALPELFQACRKIVIQKRAKRRQKLLDKYQYLKTSESESDEPEARRIDENHIKEENESNEPRRTARARKTIKQEGFQYDDE
ncbi:uncharacterized protein LOC129767912 [Toxorhynchites rutilus septentrionalis]|uniref:uncharacterized protein LOC129767912 n=1 Tax=Toxorhynchites rutilus septentrionalis TaxID=329112 RepID=UPI0024793DB9|nr:uncharacterized protein LOC129767912 [Toxorhynchites rutilus septentrionalis]